ncbi:hypothetical protein [Limnospira maxima]|uniref:hypothetical protein n=1 Tax=Limnospira TaxID=2596745 RepID=UPI0002FDC76A|nr:hypothetical protein [Limnospira maxima]
MPRPAAILGILPAQFGYIPVKIDGIPPMELPPDGTDRNHPRGKGNYSPRNYGMAAMKTRRSHY